MLLPSDRLTVKRMKQAMLETHAGGFVVGVDRERINVRIPRLETEMFGSFIDDELLPRVDRFRGTSWAVDLSEYEDGLTLSLARMLERLGEEARRRGCMVTFSGISDNPIH